MGQTRGPACLRPDPGGRGGLEDPRRQPGALQRLSGGRPRLGAGPGPGRHRRQAVLPRLRARRRPLRSGDRQPQDPLRPGPAGRRRARPRASCRRPRSVAGLRRGAGGGQVHRLDPHDLALDPGLEGLRAVALRADREPGDRRALPLCDRRLRGDPLRLRHRPARYAARPAGPLGARVPLDRRAAGDLRGPAAGGDLDRRPGGEGPGLRPPGLGRRTLGGQERPDPRRLGGDGPLRLVEGLARSRARDAAGLPGGLAGGPRVPPRGSATSCSTATSRSTPTTRRTSRASTG